MTNYSFGKHPPKRDYRTLRFKDYLTRELKAPPEAYSVLPRVYQNLKMQDPTKLFPMDGNDTLGDCTIAALAHAVTIFSGLVGKENVASRQAVVKVYLHLTGGANTGLNELDVLNYWQSHAVAKDKILAFASIDPKNHDHVKSAIELFGGVYLGFQVQQNCISDFDARKPWSPGPLTRDGHAVFAVAYDPQFLTVLTWGNTQQAEWSWWDECVDEAYAVLPMDAKDPKFAPGYNLAQLQEDLQLVANG
jgi:hypothetical protein